jgi:hypothetical protein
VHALHLDCQEEAVSRSFLPARNSISGLDRGQRRSSSARRFGAVTPRARPSPFSNCPSRCAAGGMQVMVDNLIRFLLSRTDDQPLEAWAGPHA